MKKYLIPICVVLVLAAVCTGCILAFSKTSQTEGGTEALDANTGALPAEAALDKVPGLSDLLRLYARTDRANVISLERLGLKDGRVQDAAMKDGYVMLNVYNDDTDAENAGKLVLFPLNAPEALVSMKASSDKHYSLLDGGTVLEVGDEGVHVLYDAGLEAVCRGQAGGTFLGASGDGDLWFFESGEQLSMYRNGAPAMTLDAGDLTYCAFLGQKNEKAYFDVIKEGQGQMYLCVDLPGFAATEIHMLYDVLDVSHEAVCYYSEEFWYVAGLEDPQSVLAFTKPYSDEVMWQMDDCYLIGQHSGSDATGNGGNCYCVYDMGNGGLLVQVTGADLGEHDISMLAYDQGLILYADTDDSGTQPAVQLYLWDLRELPSPSFARYYKKLDFHIDQARIDDLIGILHNIYDINIYYDEAHLAGASNTYQLSVCTDPEKIGYALVMLRECMAEYPVGFFDEIRTAELPQVTYYLCDGHIPTRADAFKEAAATTGGSNGTISMTFDVHYWWEMRTLFLHENVHAMEKRLAAEAGKINQTDYKEYWREQLNSPQYPSMQSYVWDQTGDDQKGVYGYDSENVWYIDAYSKCAAVEDRARTLDRSIHSQNAKYYQFQHIDRKLRFLNALIREEFPCVQNSKEAVFWEAYTGIVDLHEEFPDFAIAR